MRIYLKYILVIFILIWTLGVFYMFVSNNDVSSNRSGGSRRRVVEREQDAIDNLNKHEDGDMEESLNSIDQYKRDFGQLKAKYAAEIKKAYNEIDKLKEQNEKQQQEIVRLRYYFFYIRT